MRANGSRTLGIRGHGDSVQGALNGQQRKHEFGKSFGAVCLQYCVIVLLPAVLLTVLQQYCPCVAKCRHCARTTSLDTRLFALPVIPLMSMSAYLPARISYKSAACLYCWPNLEDLMVQSLMASACINWYFGAFSNVFAFWPHAFFTLGSKYTRTSMFRNSTVAVIIQSQLNHEPQRKELTMSSTENSCLVTRCLKAVSRLRIIVFPKSHKRPWTHYLLRNATEHSSTCHQLQRSATEHSSACH
jgi:hypothetical protein